MHWHLSVFTTSGQTEASLITRLKKKKKSARVSSYGVFFFFFFVLQDLNMNQVMGENNNYKTNVQSFKSSGKRMFFPTIWCVTARSSMKPQTCYEKPHAGQSCTHAHVLFCRNCHGQQIHFGWAVLLGLWLWNGKYGHLEKDQSKKK